MELTTQKKLAASVLHCSPKRVAFDHERLEEIKEAITKKDIRLLISGNAIKKLQASGISRARANKIRVQKSKGRQKGHGSRKGTHGARQPAKESWMQKVRLQRRLIKELKDKKIITLQSYHLLYAKVGGGFFRSRKHLKLYINEHEMVVNHGKK